VEEEVEEVEEVEQEDPSSVLLRATSVSQWWTLPGATLFL
jgi:hypothetical protein